MAQWGPSGCEQATATVGKVVGWGRDPPNGTISPNFNQFDINVTILHLQYNCVKCSHILLVFLHFSTNGGDTFNGKRFKGCCMYQKYLYHMIFHQVGIFVAVLSSDICLASRFSFFFFSIVIPLPGMGGGVTICGKFERAAGHRRVIFSPNSLPHPPTLEKQEQTSKNIEKFLQITTKLCWALESRKHLLDAKILFNWQRKLGYLLNSGLIDSGW